MPGAEVGRKSATALQINTVDDLTLRGGLKDAPPAPQRSPCPDP